MIHPAPIYAGVRMPPEAVGGDPARMIRGAAAPPPRARRGQAAADDGADQPGHPGLPGHRLRPLDRSASLPDRNDRHVLAAAIRSGAQVIVTTNLKDFPREVLADFDIDARHPDDFILDLADLDPAIVTTSAKLQRAALKNPPLSPVQLVVEARLQAL